MDNIIQRLKDAYTAGQYAEIIKTLLPKLFQQYEEGKIVKIPCAIGDIVYTTYISGSGQTREIVPFPFHLEDLGFIGKTVFLTREEAEKALRECEK